MTIQVVEADVKKSANSIETAADNVNGISTDNPLTKVAGALPSSVSADYAKTLKADWKKQKDNWVKAAHAHHKTTVADAAHLTKTDVVTGQATNQQQRALDDHMINRLGPIR